MLHTPKALPRAADLLRRRPDKHPPLDGFQQRLQVIHPAQPRIHVGQFARGAVSDRLSVRASGVLGQRPGPRPGIQRQGVVRRVVILQAKVRQQRRRPGRAGMRFEEAGQAGKVIRPAALRVAQQRGGERGILPRARFAADRDERFLEHPGAEDVLRPGLGWKLKMCLGRLNLWDGPVRDRRRDRLPRPPSLAGLLERKGPNEDGQRNRLGSAPK